MFSFCCYRLVHSESGGGGAAARAIGTHQHTPISRLIDRE